MAALFDGTAECGKSLHAVGIGGGVAILIEGPADRDRDPGAPGDLDLAERDRGRREIDDQRASTASGNGEPDGIGAELRLGAVGGHHDFAGVGHRHPAESGLGRHHGVGPGDAKVVAATNGGEADTGFLGLGDGAAHGLGANQQSQRVVPVEGKRGSKLPLDGHLGVGIDQATLQTADIGGHASHAVGFHAPHVRDEQVAGGGFGL